MGRNQKEYLKQYRKKHRKEILRWHQEEFQKNKEKHYKKHKKYLEDNPWFKTWKSINSRIKSTNSKIRKYYLDINIKNKLGNKELKYLWFRDNAEKMKNPEIHRKDSKKDYTIENCSYIEGSVHAKIHHRNKNK